LSKFKNGPTAYISYKQCRFKIIILNRPDMRQMPELCWKDIYTILTQDKYTWPMPRSLDNALQLCPRTIPAVSQLFTQALHIRREYILSITVSRMSLHARGEYILCRAVSRMFTHYGMSGENIYRAELCLECSQSLHVRQESILGRAVSRMFTQSLHVRGEYILGRGCMIQMRP